MEAAGDSESHPPLKEEDSPVTVGRSIPTPEKGDVGFISSRRPTPQGRQRGGEADDPLACDRVNCNAEKDEEERKEEEHGVLVEPMKHDGKEDSAFTCAHSEPQGSEGVHGETLVVAGDIPAPVKEEEPAPVKEEEGPVAEGSKSLTTEVVEEIVERFLVSKPVVIACGHVFCVGCARNCMNVVQSSECPVCKKRYNYLPCCCDLISDLVDKLRPIQVRIEETEAQEAQKAQEAGICSLPTGLEEDGKTVELTSLDQCSIQMENFNCVICQELLYKPTVLNCGHVFCISCVVVAGGEIIKCPTCGIFHPNGSLAICKDLNNFIEDFFPTAYKSRNEKAKSLSGITASRESLNNSTIPSDITHVGVGCDFCGVYPIQGGRYSCKTCTDFDLCEKCAKIDFPVEGRSGQQHLPDHVLEINNSFLLSTVLGALDKKEQSTWEWLPRQLQPQPGMMNWHPGQQAPEDEDGDEPEVV